MLAYLRPALSCRQQAASEDPPSNVAEHLLRMGNVLLKAGSKFADALKIFLWGCTYLVAFWQSISKSPGRQLSSILYSALHMRAALQLHTPSIVLAAVVTLLSKQPICKRKDLQVTKVHSLLSHQSFRSFASSCP